MALLYDKIAKVITIPAPTTEITIQTLLNEIRTFEASQPTLDIDQIASAAGKEPLGGGVSVGVTLTLLNNWRIAFEARSGPTWIQCRVNGGNLVGFAGADVIYPTAFVQVLITASSSATTSELEAIQYASYQESVWIDVVNGTHGTLYPWGTPFKPVANLVDAAAIAATYGFKQYRFVGDFTFVPGDVVYNKDLIGEGFQKSTFTFIEGSVTAYCEVIDAKITGVAIGIVGITRGHLMDAAISALVPASGDFVCNQSLVEGIIGIPANYTGTLKVLDCWAGGVSSSRPIVNIHGATCNAIVRNFSGGIEIQNMSAPTCDVSMDIISGTLVLASSVTGGTITANGIGRIVDNSSGATVNIGGLLSDETITRTTWDTVHINTISGTAGTAFPIGTSSRPVSNLADALTIANKLGIKKFSGVGEITITTACEGLTFIGYGDPENSRIHMNGKTFTSCEFQKVLVTGSMIAIGCSFSHSYITDVTNISGSFDYCSFEGSIKIEAGKTLSSIKTIIEGDNTVFDLQHSSATASMDIDSGWSQFVNAVTGSLIELNVKGGEVTLDASCTGGEYYLEGIGTLFNNSAMTVKENHFNWDEPRNYHEIPGSFGKTDEWAGGSGGSPAAIADAVWNEALSGHTTVGSAGKILSTLGLDEAFIKKHLANRLVVASNQLTVYDDDGTTPILVQNLFDNVGAPTMQAVYRREPISIPVYTSPSFLSFAISGQSTPLEVGDSILADRTFVWSTSYSGNVATNSIALKDITGGVTIVSGVANTGSKATTYGAVTKATATSNIFRVEGIGLHSETFNRSYVVDWLWRIFYGESTAAGPLVESAIEGLRVSSLAGGFAGVYTFAGGGYKYIAYPSVFGTATMFKDSSTNLDIPFETAYTVSVTNSFGVMTTYRVHRSTNIMGGAVGIVVS